MASQYLDFKLDPVGNCTFELGSVSICTFSS